MHTSPSTFLVIPALVVRHVQDAAFYWSQLDWTLDSPLVGFERLQHFNRVLDAHLDGMYTAGPAGWEAACSSLERWRKPGEAFSCVTLAARQRNDAYLDQVRKLLCRHPDLLLRGAISALAWCTDDDFASVATRWSANEAEPAVQVAVLRAVCLRGQGSVSYLRFALSHYLTSSDPHVRAAACRVANILTEQELPAAMRERALTDADLAVRAEAAIAAIKHGELAALSVLWECIDAQVARHRQASGWEGSQSERRLRRWVRQLAIVTPLREPLVASALALLPPREALIFLLYHGDLAQLPFVVDQMANPSVGRYAGWVWYCLTGVDLLTNGLTLAETDPGSLDASQPVTAAQLDADNGLRQPNAAAVHSFMQGMQHTGHNKRMLLGSPLSLQRAVELLHHAPQAIRTIVAHRLLQVRAPVHINVRGRSMEQSRAMDRLADWMRERVSA